MAAKLVMGNWKMHGSLASNRKLIHAMLQDRRINRAGVALASPSVYLLQLVDLLQMSPVALAAQDVSQFGRDGAFTGEVSATMLANIGCRYVLIGHSERRQYLAESPSVLAQKLANSTEAQLTPVLCVGETLAQRESGEHLAAIAHQLEIVAPLSSAKMLVAYEPVWAIGTGRVATLDQIREMHDWIKSVCLQWNSGSGTMRVLYGGSVKADNAEAILSINSVDGALVGGASLDVESFGMICQAADKLV
jgi:triosephosphate isomerase